MMRLKVKMTNILTFKQLKESEKIKRLQAAVSEFSLLRKIIKGPR